MTIDELAPLTNGLTVRSGKQTFTCDRARITRFENGTIEMSFWIAGTDFAPRLRLTPKQIGASTREEIAQVVRHVAERAIAGDPSHRAA
jgi:hypothetical protein